MSDIVYVVDAINNLADAVKTQDNHVLSDLDTYPVTMVLTQIRDELKNTNKELKLIREAIQDGYCR